MAARHRTLTGEERALWDAAMRDAKPLGPVRPRNKAPRAEPPPKQTPSAIAKPPAPPRAPAAKPPKSPAPPGPPDRATSRKLRRGALSIDRRIDLHGLTQAEAYRVLESVVLGGAARRLLVVTGRGAHKAEGGVLRRMVPRWLAEPAFADRVVACGIAGPGHGGEGAYYVLLRRAATRRMA